MTGAIIAYRSPGATETQHFGPCDEESKNIFLEVARRWSQVKVLYLVSIRPKPPKPDAQMPICLDEGGGP